MLESSTCPESLTTSSSLTNNTASAKRTSHTVTVNMVTIGWTTWNPRMLSVSPGTRNVAIQPTGPSVTSWSSPIGQSVKETGEGGEGSRSGTSTASLSNQPRTQTVSPSDARGEPDLGTRLCCGRLVVGEETDKEEMAKKREKQKPHTKIRITRDERRKREMHGTLHLARAVHRVGLVGKAITGGGKGRTVTGCVCGRRRDGGKSVLNGVKVRDQEKEGWWKEGSKETRIARARMESDRGPDEHVRRGDGRALYRRSSTIDHPAHRGLLQT
ncbi:hypothetical protein EW146_g10280 [Bondarzewia mesenterica]|uniref:Uncharacterized protein n=1 Tax=Bondarzewia mesenterica TaxID=1095465 RepID=A0A4S4L3G7_9AGAM|nr:hypothetical protein EW146_g10280 [Bondarzewia mesenterica]